MQDIIKRKEWNARAFDGTPSSMGCSGIVVHHTAGRIDDGSRANFVQEMKGIQDTHQLSNGWSDIGYHFVIGAGGHVAEGRPGSAEMDWVVGAHAGGYNKGRVGICLMGCFHPKAGAWCGDKPTAKQIEALTRLVAEIMRKEGVRPEGVRPHSDFKATACCGDLLRRQLPDIRSAALRVSEEPPGNGSTGESPRGEPRADTTRSGGSGSGGGGGQGAATLIGEIEDRLGKLRELL